MLCGSLLLITLWFAGNTALGGVKRPAQGNLLANGGFEQGAAGWSFLVSGANATGGVDSAERHEGRFAYKLTNRSAFAPHVYGRIVQVVSGLQPFATYRVSCWVKGKGCGLNWIGGGPGWLTRTPFPKGDFEWQPVSFEIDAGATPDSYELMVVTESPTEVVWVDDIRFELVRVDQAKQEATYAQLDSQLEGLKQKLAALQATGRRAETEGNSYVRLGTAVAERFIKFAETGGPSGAMGLAWTRLQLAEVEQVLQQTEGQVRNDSPTLRWHAPPAGAVKLKNGTFYRHGRPWYFAGYGHFHTVIQDLPDFADLGASLVQDGRAGPSSMNPDGSLQANATNVLLGFDRAARSGMRVDFLLSPHYYPDWGAASDLHNGNIGFLGFNIFHPKAKAVVAQWTQAMAQRLKDKPALHSVCLANEPVYNSSGRDAYTRPEFARYLRKQHRQVAALNVLYGSRYGSFEEVPVPPDSMPQTPEARRAYYDWTCFNKQMFADWHAWLASLLKAGGLKAPTHTKIMVFQSFDRDKVGWGVDPELMCAATDLAGCDAYAFLSGGPYAYDWFGQEFFYDLLHSFRGQPVFNSENHLIPDGSPPAHMPMDHTRSVIWQGGLHHQGSTTIWVWEQAADSSLAGSIYFRPANVYGAGRAMEDLNRLAQEVTAINTAKPDVALLYSPPSIFWEPKYQPSIYLLYTALNFLGLNITFVSERQLAQGTVPRTKWIIVPNASHVLATTPPALARFAKAGGKILVAGNDSLSRDEYDRPLEPRPAGYPTMQLADPDQATATVLSQSLASLRLHELRDSATGKPAWGVEFRVVPYQRSILIPLINFNKETKVLQFPSWADQRALDLLSGEEVNPNAIRLEPMVPRLLRPADPAWNPGALDLRVPTPASVR